MAKGNYDKAIDYVNQHTKSFGLILDKRRLIVKALHKKQDYVGCINEILGIIRDNFNNVDQY